MKTKFRRILALVMTVVLVATTITFTAGNTLKAEGEAPAEPAQAEQAAEPVSETKEPVVESESISLDSENSSPEGASAENSQDIEAAEETAEEEDSGMPAQSFDMTADNGIRVLVSAPKGAFPEGTEMKVEAISDSDALAYASEVDENAVDAAGVDITFYHKGKEIQPQKEIKVNLSNTKLKGEDFGICHVGKDGAEKVSGTATSNKASFSADTFSIYLQYGSKEEDNSNSRNGRASTGSNQVIIGNTIELKSNADYGKQVKYDHEWTSSDAGVASVINTTNDGKNATVKGLKKGSVTITHRYKASANLAGVNWRTETMTVTVIPPTATDMTGISGADSMYVFDVIKITPAVVPANAEPAITWTSDNEDILVVDNNGNVTGKSEGTAKITATAVIKGETKKFTKEIEVNKAKADDRAQFYYLKNPTCDPASNSTDDWGPCLGNGEVNAKNLKFEGKNASIKSQPGRVISWPTVCEGGSVQKNSSHWNTILDAYNSVLVANNATKDDVAAIYLHPFKMSQNNFEMDDGPDRHVDCTVEIVTKDKVHTASYYLWDTADTDYVWKQAETVRNGNQTSLNSELAALQRQKNVGDKTYKFEGWYLNSDLSGGTVKFPYTVTKNVDFYAKYIDVTDYKVEYDTNGGTPAISTSTKKVENSVVVNTTVPKKAGYTFKGWKSNGIPEAKAMYNGGDTFKMPANNVKFTAQWEKKIANAKLNVTSYNGKYDSKSHGKAATVTGTDAAAFTTIEYKVGEDGAWTTEVPTIKNVGTKEVSVRATSDNYTELTAKYTLKVSPAEVTVTADNKSKKYGEADPKLTATVAGTFGEDKISYTLSREKGEDVGEYKITASGDKTQGNYAVTFKPGVLKIEKVAANAKLEAKGYEGVYDGERHAGTVSLTGDHKADYTLEYKVDGGQWTTEAPNIKNVGEKAVKVKAVSERYADLEAVEYTLKVTKRTISIKSASATKKYDGTALMAPSVEIGKMGLANGDDLLVKFGSGQIDVGTSDNTFSYAFVGKGTGKWFVSQSEANPKLPSELELTELANNYDVEVIFGKLEVTASPTDNVSEGNTPDGPNNGGGAIIRVTADGNGGYTITTIDEGKTPLANSLLDVDCCILHLLIMLAALIMLLWYTYEMKRRQRRILDLEEQLKYWE